MRYTHVSKPFSAGISTAMAIRGIVEDNLASYSYPCGLESVGGAAFSFLLGLVP